MNGSDLLEWEEKNQTELEEEFISRLGCGKLKDWVLESGEIMDILKAEHPNEWGLFVSDQFDNSLG